MSLTRSAQIEVLCKKIAEDYEGWEYTAKAFKNKQLKYVTKIIDFGWMISSVSTSSQPIVAAHISKVQRIWKIIGRTNRWTQFLRIPHPDHPLRQYDGRFEDVIADNAEAYIREVLDIGMRMLEENWDFSSEENLLRNLPELLEDDMGTRYCIARILLGDFDYIERYYNDEIETIRPKRKSDLEKIMAHLPEFRTAYEKKGILF